MFKRLFGGSNPTTDALLAKATEAEAATPALDLCQRSLVEPLFRSFRAGIAKWTPQQVASYAAAIAAGTTKDQTHESYLYNFLVHAVADELESGRHHIYRGVLNPDGHAYKLLFEHFINTMIAFGAYTKQYADEELRKPVYKGIQDVG